MSRNDRRTRPAVDGERRDWYRIVNAADSGTGTAEVLIYDEIGYWGVMAADFARDVNALDVDELTVRINSPGGEVHDGVAILNTLRDHKATITVIVDGLAASAASFIAMAGDEIVMNRNAEMMIHDAWGLCRGNADEMAKYVDYLEQVSDNVASIYAERAGGTADEWRSLMREETWYTAQEAVDAGLADRVAEKKTGSDSKGSNRFDLSVFNYAGRGSAPAPKFPRPANRAEVRPGNKSRASTNPADVSAAGVSIPEGGSTVEFTEEQFAALREALDLSDDATIDGVVTAIEDLVTKPEGKGGAGADDDTAVVDRATLDRLVADAALGRDAHARQVRDDRERAVDSAISAGRIPPSKRDSWLTRLEVDPTEADTLAKLEPVYPVGEPLGHDGKPQGDSAEAIYDSLFGKDA